MSDISTTMIASPLVSSVFSTASTQTKSSHVATTSSDKMTVRRSEQQNSLNSQHEDVDLGSVKIANSSFVRKEIHSLFTVGGQQVTRVYDVLTGKTRSHLGRLPLIT